MLNRRQFFVSTSAVALLAGCSGGSLLPSTPSQFITDIENLAGALSQALPTVGQIPGIGTNIVAQIGSVISQIQGVAGTVTPSTTTATAQTTAQKIVGWVNTIVGIIAPIGETLLSTTPFGIVLTAAVALLPEIESLIGLGPTAPATPVAARMAATMPSTTAKSILQNAALGIMPVPVAVGPFAPTPLQTAPPPPPAGRFSRRQCLSTKTGHPFTPLHANTHCRHPLP